MQNWYLLRTKTGGERVAQQRLTGVVESTLLPLGKMQLRQQERMIERVVPLFPCYLFAFFSLEAVSRKIRYTPGVRELVQFGKQAAIVPCWVIDQLTLRCAHGPVELPAATLAQGAPVRVVGGPFRKFEAIFDEYLSGTERVAVLLSVMNAERRVVMPRTMVVTAA
jgi:transcriptional antiterminator RfaH